jgi:hypothetical protein
MAKRDDIDFVDTNHAPVVFCEAVPAFGATNSIVRMTLAAARILPGVGDQVQADFVVTAHLRLTREAAVELRDRIDHVLNMTMPPKPTDKVN